jgi:serralysin
MADIFTAILSGDQEVPTPVATDATGIGTIVWDETTTTAAYTVTVRGLDFGPTLGMEPRTADSGDDVTAMHVHAEVRGVRGPVVFGQIGEVHDSDDLSIVLNADGSWTVRGIWEATDPANVPITTFAQELTSAPVGSDVALYFVVHTTSVPAGELRGQWVASGDRTIPAPAGEALLAFDRAVAEFVADHTIPASAGEALLAFGRAAAEFADNFALG